MRVELLDGAVDLARRRVERDGATVELTEREAALLRFLVERAPEVATRAQLLTEVWGYHPDVRSRTLDTTVRRLRRKIEPAPRRPQLVQTVTGVGYRFVPPPSRPAAVSSEPVPRPAPRARVPVDVSTLRGRDGDRAALLDAVDHAGRACVCGPGGVGKSHLVRAAAHRWSTDTGGAAWWVPVDGADTVDALATRIARTLSLRLSPSDDRGAALGRRLGRMGPLLLALDGADAAGADVLEALASWVDGSETLAVIVTRRIRPDASWPTMRLRPLDAEAARAILVERVRQRLPGFDADEEALAPLLRSLGGLPLALALAAARVRILGVEALTERLERGDDLLRDWADPGEHGSLERVLARSWELLPDPLQDAATRLCAIRGPFHLELAEAMVDDGASMVEALVDSGWVELRPDPEGAPAFEVLDCVRSHVLRRTHGPPAALADALSALADTRLDPVFGPVSPDACAWVRRRAADLEAVVASGRASPAVVWATSHAGLQVGDDRAALAAWEALPDAAGAWFARARCSLLGPEVRAEALDRAEALAGEDRRLAGAVALARGRLLADADPSDDRALDMLSLAADAFEASGDGVGLAEACRVLAFAYGYRGQWDRVAAVRARGLAAVADRSTLVGIELLVAPYPLPREHQPSLDALRSAIDDADQAGERRLRVRLRAVFAMELLSIGRTGPALREARLAVDEVGGLQSPTLRAGVLGNMAIVLRELACFDEAAACFGAALDGLPDGAHDELRLVMAVNRATLRVDQGQLDAALDELERARHLTDDPLARARLDTVAGMAERLAGRAVEQRWRACLEVFRSHDAPTHAARVGVLLATLDPVDADALLTEARAVAQRYDDRSIGYAAEALWVARGHAAWSTPPADRPPVHRWVSLVRIVRRLAAVGAG